MKRLCLVAVVAMGMAVLGAVMALSPASPPVYRVRRLITRDHPIGV